jgi:hypothetical protein
VKEIKAIGDAFETEEFIDTGGIWAYCFDDELKFRWPVKELVVQFDGAIVDVKEWLPIDLKMSPKDEDELKV